jgi:hypothetical protein
MNKITIILFAVSIVFVSCRFEEDDLFEDSAANRLTQSQKTYTEALCKAPNGWVMDYFPNIDNEYAISHPTVDLSGRTLLVKFEDGAAYFAAKNDLTNNRFERDTCTFQVIADNGPVLSFNSYGTKGLLHRFADPGPYPTSEELGMGYWGDYEFMVLSATDDIIKLKGKKRGVYIDLHRLPDNQDWEGYFQLLAEQNNIMFAPNVTIALCKSDNILYTLSKGTSHTFDVVPFGGDPISETTKRPFIVTDYGIHLAQGFEIEKNVKVQNFNISTDKNELVCTDNGAENVKIVALPPVNVFMNIINANKYMIFKHTDDNMGLPVKSAFEVVNNKVIEKTRILSYIGFVNNRNWGISLSINTKKGTSTIEGFLGFDISIISGNEVSLIFKGFSGNYDNNGKTYYDTYAVSDFVSLIEGDYTLSLQGYTLSSTTVRFVSKNDSNKWFDLLLK